MFKGQGQTTLEPSVLSTLYILIPCLLASDRFCFYREDKPDFGTMEGIYVSETFLVFKHLKQIMGDHSPAMVNGYLQRYNFSVNSHELEFTPCTWSNQCQGHWCRYNHQTATMFCFAMFHFHRVLTSIVIC